MNTSTASNDSTLFPNTRTHGATPAMLVGQAIGDALGCAFEFCDANGSELRGWKGEMRGGGWGLKTGQYTDDTKMALCIARSLQKSPALDTADLMARYVEWVRSGDLRGIGSTCSRSIHEFMDRGDLATCGATGEYAAGNGTAMRAGVFGLMYRPENVSTTAWDAVVGAAVKDAELTHNNDEAKAGSAAVAMGVAFLSMGATPEEALDSVIAFNPFPASKVVANLKRARTFLPGGEGAGIASKAAMSELGTSGYVVHTVAASFYALCKTTTFRDAVIMAVRGGSDADTTGAVTGALAGAFYGLEGLPADYLAVLEDREAMTSLERDLRALPV